MHKKELFCILRKLLVRVCSVWKIDTEMNLLRMELNGKDWGPENGHRFEAQRQALLRVEQVLDARLQHLEEDTDKPA